MSRLNILIWFMRFESINGLKENDRSLLIKSPFYKLITEIRSIACMLTYLHYYRFIINQGQRKLYKEQNSRNKGQWDLTAMGLESFHGSNIQNRMVNTSEILKLWRGRIGETRWFPKLVFQSIVYRRNLRNVCISY